MVVHLLVLEKGTMIIVVLSFSLGAILGSFKTILEIIKLIIDIKKLAANSD